MEEKAIEVASVAKKKAEVMAEVHNVPKNGVNKFHGYKYVMESDLSDAVRKKLAERGVAFSASVKSYEHSELHDASGKPIGFMVFVTVTFSLHDSESGETLSEDMVGAGYDKGDKAIYKAITGATKYWIYKNFLISTNDDPEQDSKVDYEMAEREQRDVEKNKLSKLKKISAAQRTRMFTIARDLGWKEEELRSMLKARFKVESTKDIPVDLYETIISMIEAPAPGSGPNLPGDNPPVPNDDMFDDREPF